MNDIKGTVKSYILQEFLPGENPSELTDSVPLITGGVLDSLATLRLVTFLEEKYNIQLQAHETGIDYLNTLDDIAALVESKL